MKRYEEAENYIENGLTTYAEILADCKEIAVDKELRESMESQAGTVEDYASEIFAAVQELTAKK